MRWYEIIRESWDDYPPWDDHGTPSDYELNSLGVLSWDEEMEFQDATDRPYSASKVVELPIDDIVGSEKYVHKQSGNNANRSSELPVVFLYKGVYRANDGNHRLHRMKSSGIKVAQVRLVDFGG